MAVGMDIAMYGQDGMRWDVHCTRTRQMHGRQGIVIGDGQVDGIVDAPLEQEWDDSVTGVGGVLKHTRFKPRDMLLGFELSDERARSSTPGELESAVRRSFTHQLDPWNPNAQLPRIELTTDLSGTRTLWMQCFETPEVEFKRDPFTRKHFTVLYHVRAGEPRWNSSDDPRGEMTVFEGTGASKSGTITVSNPTDLPMWVTWRLTRGTWTIPDPSWQGAEGERVPAGKLANRSIPLQPILSTDGGVTITRDRGKLHATTFTGSNFLGRMNGNWVRHEIPPYTPETELPISYTGAPSGGARAELWQPRLWSRPWGMEL